MAFLSIDDAVNEIRNGRVIIVTDDKNRENEGDFITAAETITAETVNFMLQYGRGMLCVPMTARRLDELRIPVMVPDSENNSLLHTNFMVTVDAAPRHGITTGISAAERAKTIRLLADPDSTAEDFVRPGHINPLRAMEGGVLRRVGHTEAAVDLVTLASMRPVAALIEILDNDGSAARLPRLMELAREFDLGIVTIEQLVEYRRRNEKLVDKVLDVNFPTRWGDFRLHLFVSRDDNKEHLALVKGDPAEGGPVLVRMHSECLTGDTLGSAMCDCGEQLATAMQLVAEAGRGVVVYMRQEGRGIGLVNKLKAYKLQQEEGLDTYEANQRLGFSDDLRDYGVGAQILWQLGVREMRLLTNNPEKRVGLEGYGLRVVERLPLSVGQTQHNVAYLEAKRRVAGHRFAPDPAKESSQE